VNGQSADGGGWLYYVGTSPYGSAITDSTGNLYVRFANLPGGPTAALDRDGKELWSASGGAPIAMGADGTIYSLNLNDNPADTITALSP
ncbi:MAG TPA: hypothetical protein VIF09_24190, partial [Polyangiaceae bacterium]